MIRMRTKKWSSLKKVFLAFCLIQSKLKGISKCQGEVRGGKIIVKT